MAEIMLSTLLQGAGFIHALMFGKERARTAAAAVIDRITEVYYPINGGGTII
jgi:hypothetical protein